MNEVNKRIRILSRRDDAEKEGSSSSKLNEKEARILRKIAEWPTTREKADFICTCIERGSNPNDFIALIQKNPKLAREKTPNDPRAKPLLHHICANPRFSVDKRNCWTWIRFLKMVYLAYPLAIDRDPSILFNLLEPLGPHDALEGDLLDLVGAVGERCPKAYYAVRRRKQLPKVMCDWRRVNLVFGTFPHLLRFTSRLSLEDTGGNHIHLFPAEEAENHPVGSFFGEDENEEGAGGANQVPPSVRRKNMLRILNRLAQLRGITELTGLYGNRVERWAMSFVRLRDSAKDVYCDTKTVGVENLMCYLGLHTHDVVDNDLLRLVARHSSIRRLRLHRLVDKAIQVTDLSALADLVNLHSLVLKVGRVGDELVLPLIELVKKSTHLQNLDLRGTRIADPMPLFEAVGQSRSIRTFAHDGLSKTKQLKVIRQALETSNTSLVAVKSDGRPTQDKELVDYFCDLNRIGRGRVRTGSLSKEEFVLKVLGTFERNGERLTYLHSTGQRRLWHDIPLDQARVTSVLFDLLRENPALWCM